MVGSTGRFLIVCYDRAFCSGNKILSFLRMFRLLFFFKVGGVIALSSVLIKYRQCGADVVRFSGGDGLLLWVFPGTIGQCLMWGVWKELGGVSGIFLSFLVFFLDWEVTHSIGVPYVIPHICPMGPYAVRDSVGKTVWDRQFSLLGSLFFSFLFYVLVILFVVFLLCFLVLIAG